MGWKAGKKEGTGTYTDADGHKYEGRFKDDKREGACTFTYFDGSKYEGNYVNDKKEGYGTFTYADGQKYEGSWINGKRHGKGAFRYADGSKYEGDWRNHLRDGEGKFTDADGTVRVGIWKDDQLVDVAKTVMDAAGRCYLQTETMTMRAAGWVEVQSDLMAKVVESFRILDVAGDGRVSREQLGRLLIKLGLAEADVEYLLANWKCDAHIDIAKFVAWLHQAHDKDSKTSSCPSLAVTAQK